MNDSNAKISLHPLPRGILQEEGTSKKINAQCDFPRDQFTLQSSDILNDFAA